MYKGRSMDPKGTLEAHGITSNATITSVRRVLVPEGVFSMAMLPVPWCPALVEQMHERGFGCAGWKIITEGEDEDDISSDEDW